MNGELLFFDCLKDAHFISYKAVLSCGDRGNTMRKNNRVFFGIIAAAILSLSAGAAVWSVNELSHYDQITEVRAGEGNYWSGLDMSGNTYGNSFRSSLQTIMKSKKTASNPTYSSGEMWDLLAAADEDPSNNKNIRSFYANPSSSTYSVAKTNHGASKGQWNKEHAWPNSRGAGDKGPGNDPQMLRASAVSLNENRGNKMYAESGAYDPMSADNYEPARGESARVIFYTATMYYQTCGTGGTSSGTTPLELTENAGDASGLHTMGKVSALLKWNASYPVTAEEVHRNEYLAGQGYARNPFIDHPSWANYIWSVNTTDNGGGTSSNNYTRTASYTSTSSSSQNSGATSISTSGSTSSSISSSSSSVTPDSLYDAVKETSDIVTTPTRLVSIVGKGSGDDYHALKAAMINTYYVDQAQVSMSNGSMVFSDGVGTFEVEASSKNQGFYTLKDAGTTAMGYLSGTVSGTHYNLGFEAAESQNSQWNITIAADGKMVLKSASGVYAKYDSTYSDFTGSSTSADLFAFKKKAAIAVTSLSLNVETLNLKVDESSTLVATVNPENAVNKNVSWSSSDEAIASVDQTGVVVAHKVGEANITVTSVDGGKTASCLVHVNDNGNPGGGSFPTWAIVAIVTGGSVIGIGLAVLATFLVIHSRKKKDVA